MVSALPLPPWGEWSWPPVPPIPFFWPPAAPGYPPLYSTRPQPPPPGAHALGAGPGPSWAAEEPSALDDRQTGEQEMEEGGVLELLDEAEALELVEFYSQRILGPPQGH